MRLQHAQYSPLAPCRGAHRLRAASSAASSAASVSSYSYRTAAFAPIAPDDLPHGSPKLMNRSLSLNPLESVADWVEAHAHKLDLCMASVADSQPVTWAMVALNAAAAASVRAGKKGMYDEAHATMHGVCCRSSRGSGGGGQPHQKACPLADARSSAACRA
jgi:hypothetical protein